MTTSNEFVLKTGRWTRVVVTALAASVLTAAAHPRSHHSVLPKPAAVSVAEAAAVKPVAVVDAFHAALTRGDERAALGFLAEDVLIFESGGVERGRAEYASHHLAADAAFSGSVGRTRVSRSQGVGPGAAWVTSVETVSGNYRGRAVNSRSVETMLLRKSAGQWRISHIHWSSKDIAVQGAVGLKPAKR